MRITATLDDGSSAPIYMAKIMIGMADAYLRASLMSARDRLMPFYGHYGMAAGVIRSRTMAVLPVIEFLSSTC